MKASHLKQQLGEIENRRATLERKQESKVIEYKGNTE
jgi:hypothetical protein